MSETTLPPAIELALIDHHVSMLMRDKFRATVAATIAAERQAARAEALAEVDAAAERIIRRGAVGAWRSGDWRALELSAEYQEDEPAAGLREGLTWFIGATDADTATGAILAEAASLDRAEPAP